MSQGQLRENRNLSLSIRAKAVLIYVLSVPVHNVKKITCKFYEIYLLCVKARPSDPLVYVWILWYFFKEKKKNFYLCFGEIYLSLKVRSKIFLLIFLYGKNTYFFFAARGVRKVTTGITGLWRRSVQSDAAFWFFDVGSSYPALASGCKGKFVHLPTGNVSWV